jgi:hypothetical protein
VELARADHLHPAAAVVAEPTARDGGEWDLLYEFFRGGGGEL